MANAPYHRLRPGLLSPLWKQMRPYVRHRGLQIHDLNPTSLWGNKHHLLRFHSLLRCKCACDGADAVWSSGDHSGSSPRSAASPPAARRQRQRQLVHTRGLRLEAERQRLLTCSQSSHITPEKLLHTVPQCSTDTCGRRVLTLADAAVRHTGNSA